MSAFIEALQTTKLLDDILFKTSIASQKFHPINLNKRKKKNFLEDFPQHLIRLYVPLQLSNYDK